MSSGLKWIVGLVVIIVIAGLAVWKFGLPSGMNQPTTTTPSANQNTNTQAQSGLPTSQSDTSDAALTQDSAAVDTQIQGMSQDQSSVDSSLNDQPVQQSY